MSVQSEGSGKVNPDFRADIQGLRAVAVLGVILFHVNRDFLPGGFVGVDVFFVISGFLIGGIVLQKKAEQQFSVLEFYSARVRRIVPAYFVMLAAVTLCAAIVFTPKDFNIYWESATSAAYFGSNTYFSGSGSYFAPSSHELPLLHTWSLAVEMQFYLLLPALLVILPNKWLKPVLLVMIMALLAVGVRQTLGGDKKWAYFSLLVRIPEFLIGVLLAALERSRSWRDRIEMLGQRKELLPIVGLILILYGFMNIQEESDFPGVLIAYPCIGSALVIAGHGGRVSSMLSWAPMVWVGGVSYSLYLWHWPILAMARYVSEHYLIDSLLLAILALAVIGLSYASLRWIEKPFRRKNWFARLELPRTIALLVGVVVPIVASPRVNAAVESPLPVAYTRYADPLTICHGRVINDCIRGSRDSDSPPILVLGDSHAAQLNLFFDRIGERTGKRFRVISASSCVTIPSFDVDRLPDWARTDCRVSIEFAKKFISDSSDIVVAAMWQYQLQSEKFVLALKEFLVECQSAGKQVTLLWQVPMLTSDVQRLRRMEKLGLRSGIRIHEEWATANRIASGIAAKFSNVRFLEYSRDEMFMTPPLYHGALIYQDNHHLNEIGAVQYADVVFRQF